jgi:hypothetical protein
VKKTPGSQFQSGNKFGRGRPNGSRNKATIALQEMLDGHGESITRKCALLAMQGDPTALRLCMERLIPPRKEHLVKFKLLDIGTAGEIAAAVDDVLHDVANGQLSPAQGQMIAAILEGLRKARETEDHEARLRALESGSGRAAATKVIGLDLDSTPTPQEDGTNEPHQE